MGLTLFDNTHKGCGSLEGGGRPGATDFPEEGRGASKEKEREKRLREKAVPGMEGVVKGIQTDACCPWTGGKEKKREKKNRKKRKPSLTVDLLSLVVVHSWLNILPVMTCGVRCHLVLLQDNKNQHAGIFTSASTGREGDSCPQAPQSSLFSCFVLHRLTQKADIYDTAGRSSLYLFCSFKNN